jgi:tRNA G10  N-methylase Trm11
MKYLFQLGREPELSTAELRAVFSLSGISADITTSDGPYAIVETETPLNAEFLMRRLGGTIKIGEAVVETPADYLLSAQPTGKILFSPKGKTEALALKKQLASLGRSVRYI